MDENELNFNRRVTALHAAIDTFKYTPDKCNLSAVEDRAKAFEAFLKGGEVK